MPFGFGPTEMLIVRRDRRAAVRQAAARGWTLAGQEADGVQEGAERHQERSELASSDTSPRATKRYNADDYDEPTAPKFEPPTQQPTEAPRQDTTAPV